MNDLKLVKKDAFFDIEINDSNDGLVAELGLETSVILSFYHEKSRE